MRCPLRVRSDVTSPGPSCVFGVWLQVVKHVDFVSTGVVYLTQSVVFGIALLGISYGIVSTSFDPRREGSMLGWDEFQANLPQVLQRFKRQ